MKVMRKYAVITSEIAGDFIGHKSKSQRKIPAASVMDGEDCCDGCYNIYEVGNGHASKNTSSVGSGIISNDFPVLSVHRGADGY